MYAVFKAVVVISFGLLFLGGVVLALLGISFYVIEIRLAQELLPSNCTVLDKQIVPDLCIEESCDNSGCEDFTVNCFSPQYQVNYTVGETHMTTTFKDSQHAAATPSAIDSSYASYQIGGIYGCWYFSTNVSSVQWEAPDLQTGIIMMEVGFPALFCGILVIALRSIQNRMGLIHFLRTNIEYLQSTVPGAVNHLSTQNTKL